MFRFYRKILALSSWGRYLQNRIDLASFLRKRGVLKNELAKFPIAQSGSETVRGQSVPYILLHDGTVLYGRSPDDIERDVYRIWRKEISPLITEETFRVAMDVVLRYLYPHAMPQLTMPYTRQERSGFHPQHVETIQDLPNMSTEQRNWLLSKFAIQPGESFLDVGAYMGYGTVRMAKELGANSNVLAVEADPDSFWLLEHNVRANQLGNVQLFPVAVSSKDTQADFYKTGRQANSLISTVVESGNAIHVPVMTIDSIVSQSGVNCINRISLTINGAEVDAVTGMKTTIQNTEDVKVSIAGWYKRDGKRVCDLVEPVLREYGLRVVVGKDGGLFAWK